MWVGPPSVFEMHDVADTMLALPDPCTSSKTLCDMLEAFAFALNDCYCRRGSFFTEHPVRGTMPLYLPDLDRPPIGRSTVRVHHIDFNQDMECFSVATDTGYRIYNTNPLALRANFRTLERTLGCNKGFSA